MSSAPADGTEVTEAPQQTPGPFGLPRSAVALITATVAVGLTVAAAAIILDGAWSRSDVWACALLTGAVATAQRFWIPLRHGHEEGNFDVAESAFVAGLMLARPGPFLVAILVATVVAQLVKRVAPIKIAFNAGQHLLGLGLAALIYQALAGDVSPLDHSAWLAVGIAMAAYLVVNEGAIDLVISLVEGVPFRGVVRESAGLSAAHWATNVAIGLLAVVAWSVDRWLLPLIVAPLALAHLAYRNWLTARKEREQIHEMSEAAAQISLQTDLGTRMPETDETPALASLATTINRMLERLEVAFHRERRFMRDASHELRTPVTITRGYLEILPPDPAPEELAEAVEVALDELDRMGRLITDLTTLAKVDDPQFVLPGSIDARRFVERIVAKAKPILGDRLSVGVVPATGVIAGDEQRLTQAALNLLQNAAVHAPNGPVVIGLSRLPDHWRLEIIDQGGGLPPGTEAQVFLPFNRLDSARPGSGLGLAIVRGIVEAHGGRAGVDNRPGDGATFWIEIPS